MLNRPRPHPDLDRPRRPPAFPGLTACALSVLAVAALLGTPAAANKKKCRASALPSPHASFKIAETESPRPQDRVFINFNHFDGSARPSKSSSGAPGPPTGGPCQTDDIGPLSPPCPAPGSGSLTYIFNEHIPKDALNPSDRIFNALGLPLSASNPPCPGTTFNELPPQDNAPLMPGETLPSGDRNYQVQFTVTSPAGGPAGGQSPQIDVQVVFGLGPGDPLLAVSKVEVALVQVQGLARADRRSSAPACAYLTSTKPTFRHKPATHGLCADEIWLPARGTTSWSLKLAHNLPPGSYVAYTRATSASGSIETNFDRSLGNRVSFRVKR